MTSTTKNTLPQNLLKAEELNEESFTFTNLELKNGRVNVYVHNPKINGKYKDFNALTVPMMTSYGFSNYQGTMSITVKPKGITPEDQKAAQNFMDFCKTMQEKTKEYFIENQKHILSPKDQTKLKKNPKILQAWLNPIVKKDKNGEEEIRFKIRTDKDSNITLQKFTLEKYKIENNQRKSIEKNKIDLKQCENPAAVLSEHIKPGSHVQAVITPSVYWYGNKFGVTWTVEALMVLRSNSTTVDNEAIDLDIETIGFSPPKKNKDGVGYSALVLNTKTNGLSGKIRTGALRLAYGISEYENTPGAALDQSIVLMNQSDISEFTEANEKLFSYSEGLNEAALDYAEEHKDILFKKDDDEELTRDLIESGYFNPCVTQNKNGDDQIKLKVIKDENGIPNFACFQYDSFDNEESKVEVDWNQMDNVEKDIKNIIRGGSHIRAVIQPRIYFISNKIGINYRCVELHVQKNSYSKQNLDDVFSFVEENDVEQKNTEDSEVTIEEEEIEEEEVDSDAYGESEDDGEDDDEEVVEASA